MPDGQVLEFSAVSKRFGAVTAVDRFTARVEPGKVTGFLGPNGAGKTTTLRILLGLVRATEGTATIGGVPYAKLANPLQSVGAVLEASSFHPGRTAANHLKVYAQAADLPDSRVDEALGLVGLADVAGRKVGGYSLGMRQRLGLAYALLGDPGVLVLDEPANGLDPEGIRWMRGLLRDLARQGRTVLVSSHMLAEVQQTVDSLLIIATGRLVFQGGLEHLTDPSEYSTVVDAPDRAALIAALSAAGIEYEVLRSGLTVRGHDTATVGQAAAADGVALSTLQRRGPALEEVFLDLVNGARVHPSATGAVAASAAVAGAVAVADEAAVPEDAAVAEGAEDGGAAPAAAAAAVDADAGADAPTEAPEAVGVEHPGAAGAVAAGAVIASADDTTTDEDPSPVADEERYGETDAAAPGAATFAVAGTGVIDVVEPEPESESEAEASDDDVEPAVVGTLIAADEPDQRVDASAAASSDGEASGGESPEPIDDGAPGDDERPWDQYVRTDSDEEADRFFASYDSGEDSDGAAAGSPLEQAPADEASADESPADEASADESPAGEPRDDGETAYEPPADEPPADEPPADEPPADEPPAEQLTAETSEFGTLADLSPEWVESSQDADDDEGGESR